MYLFNKIYKKIFLGWADTLTNNSKIITEQKQAIQDQKQVIQAQKHVIDASETGNYHPQMKFGER